MTCAIGEELQCHAPGCSFVLALKTRKLCKSVLNILNIFKIFKWYSLLPLRDSTVEEQSSSCRPAVLSGACRGRSALCNGMCGAQSRSQTHGLAVREGAAQAVKSRLFNLIILVDEFWKH